MSRTEWLFLALALCVCAGPAPRAHSLSVDRGVVEVLPGQTVVRFDVAVADLVDASGDGSRRVEATELVDAALAHEADLLRRVTIREASGERLAGRIESSALALYDAGSFTRDELADWIVTYDVVFPTASPPRHLSFQDSGADPVRGIARPLDLIVRSAGLDGPRAIRLTRGGNVETLSFSWVGREAEPPKPGTCSDAGRGGDDRFRSVHVTIRIDDRGVRLDTVVPLPVLETWLPIPRADVDFVQVGEQVAAGRGLETFFDGDAVVRIDERVVSPEIEAPRFLGPDDGAREDREPGRIGSWTGRVAVAQSYRSETRPRSVSIEWRRFNGAVLTIDALVEVDGNCGEHRFSTYAPTWAWTAEDRFHDRDGNNAHHPPASAVGQGQETKSLQNPEMTRKAL